MTQRAFTSVKINLRQKQANIAELVGFHVEGLKPRQRATLHASIVSDENEAWESFAEFEADKTGLIDPFKQKPLQGTYDGVDGSGLYWSMQPAIHQKIPRFFHKLSLNPISMNISVRIDGNIADQTNLLREVLSSDVSRQEIENQSFRGSFFLPKKNPPKAALIVFGGSGGGRAEVEAAILASKGFAALALAYFAEPGLPKECFEIPVEYFAQPIAWLQKNVPSAQSKIGIVGWSAGGQLAMLVASHYPQIQAAVNFVGMPVITVGYGTTIQQRPSWAANGKGLPFIPFRADQVDMTPPIAGINGFLAGMKEASTLKAAEIPVEKIRGPVLMISGQDDRTWPCYQTCVRAFERLKAAGRSYPDRHLTFEKAGHHILVPYLPTTVHYALHRVIQMVIDFGGSPFADAQASIESWKVLVDFLNKNLATEL